MSKPDLLYIMNPNCGWCKKSDPVVEEMRAKGHKITTLDVNDSDDLKRIEEVKSKYNVQCGTPLFIDAESGNAVCGFRQDVLDKWADGEKIPPPPPRPSPPQQPQQPPQMDAILNMRKFQLEIWQEARQTLMDKFYHEMNVWRDWTFNNLEGDCPVSEMPVTPSMDNIRDEAGKIMNFIHNRG
jgi:thiol-disulfide isomerase/thioredoxin